MKHPFEIVMGGSTEGKLRIFSSNIITEEDRQKRLVPGSIYKINKVGEYLWNALERDWLKPDTMLLFISGPDYRQTSTTKPLEHHFIDLARGDQKILIMAQAFYILRYVEIVYQKVEIIGP